MKPIEIKIAWQGNSDCESCSIRSSALFAELNEEDFSKIHSPIDDLSFDANTGIYAQGDQAQSLYTLRSGYIKILHLNPDGSSRPSYLAHNRIRPRWKAIDSQIAIEELNRCDFINSASFLLK